GVKITKQKKARHLIVNSTSCGSQPNHEPPPPPSTVFFLRPVAGPGSWEAPSASRFLQVNQGRLNRSRIRVYLLLLLQTREQRFFSTHQRTAGSPQDFLVLASYRRFDHKCGTSPVTKCPHLLLQL
ncbi:hypothetical protein ABZP36_002580, partial [Zizania latifolia]